MASAEELLTYQVVISRPDRYDDPWWQVGNAGRPEQAAAALAELAARCDLEPALAQGRCWYVCEVRFAEGALLDYFVGPLQLAHLTDQLRATAAHILDTTSTGSHANGVTEHPKRPKTTPH